MHQLRPGLHVVRRDDLHLQVGVDPPWRLVVPDRPEVRRLLADLADGSPVAPESSTCHRVLQALLAADMLVEPAVLREAARSRASVAVSVQGSGAAGADATRLLRAAGCSVTDPDEATVALVMADGEPPRDVVDAHLRDGRAHLVVAATPRGFTVGPFVVPGATSCLRCVDAHRGAHDPRRAVVIEQLAGLGAAAPDPALAALATAWAVRDAVSYAEGDRPSTWSATVEIGPGLEPRQRRWARHPHCGCSWTGGLTPAEVG